MATHMVKYYVLRYDLDEGRPCIIFHYEVDGEVKSVSWNPPKEDAVYLSDMLRNEKPVYYVESADGKKWLTTSTEPVGEEEAG